MNTDLSAVDDGREGKPSASGLERLRLCPGSWAAEALMPPEVSSADAEAGTRLHRHMELGSLPENAEESEACAWAADTVQALDEALLPLQESPGEILCEQRWWSEGRSFSGQLDRVRVCGSVAHVSDYKFGRLPVCDAVHNTQLAAQALLVFDNVPGVETVFADIVAPFVCRDLPEVARYERAMLPGLRRRLDGAIERAMLPDAPLRPSERACRYCRAATVCPAARGVLLGCSAQDVKGSWEVLSPEQRVEAYRLSRLAVRWAQRVEDAIRADLASDVMLPGLTLSSGRRSFVVEDAAGAFSALAETVSAEEFAGCCSVKISALDELVHAKLKAANEKQRVADSKEFVRSVLAPFGKVKVSAPGIKEVKS